MRVLRWIVLCSLVAVMVAVANDRSMASETLLAEITTEGVEIPGLGKTPIDGPTLTSDQDAEQRAAALKELSGGAGWKRFSRNSVVAPVSIDLDYLKDANGRRLGHRVHVAFVVHASLETLKDKDLMKQMFGEADPSEDPQAVKPDKISEQELSQRGISVDEQTSFSAVAFPLLEKVLARGVLQLQQQVGDDAIVMAIKADPRFSDRNAWAPLVDEQPPAAEDWKPYQGVAGYLSVSRLTETDGTGLANACLLESTFVIHEPTDWFNGSNLLRSKLPLLLQESARKMRRKLR